MLNKKIGLLLLGVALVASACSSSRKKVDPAKLTGKNWKFNKIVKVQTVKKMISYPMKDDKMIVDARPFRAKYVKGHIPGAISIPYSKFDKMEDKLPKSKDAQLVFYCGGLKCPLSHKSAWKAEAIGYTNVSVFAQGFPKWKKTKGNYPEVSIEWLKKQIGKKKVVIIDSRPKRKKYDKAHIPGAISIPFSKFNKLKNRLPKNKKTTLVFYCGGYHCPLSHKSAKKAIKLGYKKVTVFSAGFPEWKKIVGVKMPVVIKGGAEEGSIDNKLFKKVMKKDPKQIYLIDVRDPHEFAGGSLKSAINIPVDKLEAEMGTLPTKKSVVFFCGTGARAGEAFYMVKDLKPKMNNVFYVDANLVFKKDGSFTLTKPE